MSDIVNNTYDLLGELTNLPLFLVDIPLSQMHALKIAKIAEKRGLYKNLPFANGRQ